MLSRSSIKLAQALRTQSSRTFSTLLVPLQRTPEVPSVMNEGFLLTQHAEEIRMKKYEAYN